ncbi:YlxR family protein [Chloroflexota bacterium]
MPQRTCLACRKVKAKQELIRLVRTSDSSVEVDTGSRKAGRGAYFCRAQECWEIGLKGGRLEHSLRTTLTQDNRETLTRFSKDFLKEQIIGNGK